MSSIITATEVKTPKLSRMALKLISLLWYVFTEEAEGICGKRTELIHGSTYREKEIWTYHSVVFLFRLGLQVFCLPCTSCGQLHSVGFWSRVGSTKAQQEQRQCRGEGRIWFWCSLTKTPQYHQISITFFVIPWITKLQIYHSKRKIPSFTLNGVFPGCWDKCFMPFCSFWVSRKATVPGKELQNHSLTHGCRKYGDHRGRDDREHSNADIA